MSQALTVERLDELQAAWDRLPEQLASMGGMSVAQDTGQVVSSVPALIESARRYLELTSALEYLRESERAVLAEWYRQPGEAEYELCPDTILKLARNRGWPGAKP